MIKRSYSLTMFSHFIIQAKMPHFILVLHFIVPAKMPHFTAVVRGEGGSRRLVAEGELGHAGLPEDQDSLRHFGLLASASRGFGLTDSASRNQPCWPRPLVPLALGVGLAVSMPRESLAPPACWRTKTIWPRSVGLGVGLGVGLAVSASQHRPCQPQPLGPLAVGLAASAFGL